MSADLLRCAAAKLREAANGIPTGLSPWKVLYFGDRGYPQRVTDDQARLLAQTYDGADTEAPVRPPAPVPEYIATMHPPVALALADLLDRIYVTPMVMPSVVEFAESVARAVLREPGDTP